MSAPLRLLFAGTPEIACFSLEALLADTSGAGTVIGVLTNPDRPVGAKTGSNASAGQNDGT